MRIVRDFLIAFIFGMTIMTGWAVAGTGTLSTVSSGDTIRSTDHNSLVNAAKEDWVPRNSSGVATTNGGDLGTSSIKWKKAHITAGYLPLGTILPWYDFNGTVSLPQGWMECDGSIINETNYDAAHSSGDWDIYVIATDLDGKYLPNLNDKALHGTTSATQAGTSPLTFAGNSSHQINIAHTHGGLSHNHQWYVKTDATATDSSYDSSGSSQGVNHSGATKDGVTEFSIPGGGGAHSNTFRLSTGDGSAYTSNTAPTTDSQLSATQSVKDHGLAVKFIMKVTP